MLTMKDFRGFTYKEEALEEDGKPIACEVCNKRQAVRNCCKREGDIGRTHWHGYVHTADGGLKALCRKCADEEPDYGA